MLSQAYESGEKSLGNENLRRLHEGGEIINQAGYFRTSGGRLAFESTDKTTRVIVLENRNLEQVAQTIADDASQLEWIVSGKISEYRGASFLLLSRAELKSRGQIFDKTQ